MKKNLKESYFDEQWLEMKHRLKNFLQTGDQEELHQFRVQIKKIKAFLIFLENTTAAHKLLKQFKPVKKIFRQAGDIRNAHVNLQLGSQYQINNENFENSQLQILEQGIISFKQDGPKYLRKISKVRRDLSIKKLPRLKKKAILEYYHEEIENISAFMGKLTFDEELHDCRKHIKIMMYNYKLANKALGDKLKINKGYLDDLQDKIGSWHDNVLAIELFSSPDINEKKVIARIKGDNTSLKNTIVLLAANFKEKAVSVENAQEKPGHGS